MLGKEQSDTATTYNNIALVYQAQGGYKKALEYFEKAYLVFYQRLGSDHPNIKILKENFETACKVSGVSSEPFEAWLQQQLEFLH